MKFIILKDNLKSALLKIERAVSDSSNLPILKNILLESDKKIILTATNLELAITTNAAAKVLEKGKITVPFQPLFSIISNTNSERVNFELQGESLIIKTDNYQAKLQGLKAEEFPIIPEIKEKAQTLRINSKILKEAVSQVNNAAQVSELKPELSGVLFDYQIGLLKLAATDSFRLAEKTLLNTEFNSSFEEGFKIIIPLVTIQEILKVFSLEEEINFYRDENQILFQSKESSIISRVIEGEYPDYQAIIPKEFKTTLHCDRSELINAIKLVSNFSGRSTDLKIKLKKDSKALELYSKSQAVGENNYLVPVKREGEDLDGVSFNWRYLLSGLQSISQEEIIFSLNGSSKPASLKPQGDDSAFYIVMPLEA